MDDEAGVEAARKDLGDDAIEGDGDGLDGRIEDFEREIGGGEGAGNGDLDAAESSRAIRRLDTIMGP